MKRDKQDEITGWFAGRVPDGWFVGAPTVLVDREEILVIGSLGEPELEGDVSQEASTMAALGRIKRFREDTRAERMRIADEAEIAWGRKVSWGARCADHEVSFTTQSVPVMTRLRMRERAVLDTLIDGGVARSRSEALAWCVRLVARNEEAWIAQMRDAVQRVHEVRADGPV